MGGTPFGDCTATDEDGGGLVGNPYRFTGRRLDAETGLYYYRARHYSPEMGRFLSRDPAGVWIDARNYGNTYSYCGNNPVLYLDATGKLLTICIDKSRPEYDQVLWLLDRLVNGPDGQGTEGDYAESARLLREIMKDPNYHLYIVFEKNAAEVGHGESREGGIHSDPEDEARAYCSTNEAGETVKGEGCRSSVMYFDPSEENKRPTQVVGWDKDIVKDRADGVDAGPFELMIEELGHADRGRTGMAEVDDDVEHAKMRDRINQIRGEHKNGLYRISCGSEIGSPGP